MPGTYVYMLGIWPPLALALAVALLGLYSWRRRTVPGARYFAIACLFWSLSLLALTAETAAVAPARQVAHHVLQALLQLPIVTAVACFTLDYVQPGRWLTRRTLLLLAIPLLLVALLMLTNDAHHFIWRDLSIDGTVRTPPALGGWLAIGYASLLALIQAAALLWLFAHSPQHRWPVALMLTALVVTRSLFILTVFQPDLTAPLDSALVLTIFPVLTYAIALFGFHIFDPLPAARQAVLEQIDVGVVVFDAQQRVVRLNPAAERMFGLRSAAARGKAWQMLSGNVPGTPQANTLDRFVVRRAGDVVCGNTSFVDSVVTCLGATAPAPEFALGSDKAVRWYAPVCLPLHDFRGLHIGYLLMLDDVTAARQTQAQIVEQQRALAALHEREHLARELHDTIGQVLGYAGLQVAAVSQLLEDGRLNTAAVQLARLTDVLQEAHADVRQQILNLRTTPTPRQPFFVAVQHYLEGYTANYAIGAHLAVDAMLAAATLPPETEIQLFRILQEALSNARKHGRAQRVEVTFAAEDAALRMCVTDDGCGFVSGGADMDDGHLGLRFMRERAQEVGGRLSVASTPGAGTCVAVEVPRKEP